MRCPCSLESEETDLLLKAEFSEVFTEQYSRPPSTSADPAAGLEVVTRDSAGVFPGRGDLGSPP